MDPPCDLKDLTGHFEEVICRTPPERLAASEPGIRCLLAAAQLSPADLLRDPSLSPECLVLAFQRRFFRNEAYEELLVHRCEQDLRKWFGDWRVPSDWREDLLQALHLHLFSKALVKFDPAVGSFTPWLKQVAYHFWCGELRRIRPTVPLELVPEQAERCPSPPEQAVAEECRVLVEQAVEELPECQRTALRGAAEGKSADEVSREMGVEKASAYRWLFRGRREVERRLGLRGVVEP